MPYRLHYVFAIFALGALVGAFVGQRSPHFEPHRVARAYWIAIVAVVAAWCLLIVVDNTASGVVPRMLLRALRFASDLLLGGMLGFAASHKDRRWELLRERRVLQAVCIVTAVGFAMPRLFGDTQGWRESAGFFAQSGYSESFMRFIMTVEVLGGIALLVDFTLIPAAIGLALDMFGAIYTHVHNGDSIGDCTAAIDVLLRLGVIATLWLLQHRRPEAAKRHPFVVVAMTGAIAAAVAVAGGVMMHHLGAPSLVRTASASEPPHDADMDDLIGDWLCAGRFASGKSIESDLHFEKTLDGHGLLFRHDDRPPNGYHALGQWSFRDRTWVASLHDASGGARLFYSEGWQNGRLVWLGGEVASERPVVQRFVFERKDPSHFELAYEVEQSSGDWKRIDTVACAHP